MVSTCWSIMWRTMLSCIIFGFLAILIYWWQRRLTIGSKFKTTLGTPISSWINMIINDELSTSMSPEKLFCKSQRSCNFWLESETVVINVQFFLFLVCLICMLLACCCICLLVVTTIICLFVVIAIVCLLLGQKNRRLHLNPVPLI